jgi:Zinc finger, C2H2 type/Zinc-finger of C2H2 type
MKSPVLYEVKVMHQDPMKRIKCHICHQTFDRKKEKIDHLAGAHNGTVALQCHLCSYKPKSVTSLDSHLMLHENPDLLQSLDIPKPKQTPYDVPQSIRQESSAKASRSKMASNARRDPHRCYICNMEFKMRSAKDEHLNTAHADFDLKCKLCKRKCRSVLGMDEHLQIHENPDLLAHMCYICSRFFRRAYELNAHIKYDHRPKSKDYACDHCGYQAFIKENLKKHIEDVHLNVKKFGCEICPDKRFTTKVSLDQHRIARHGMETDIACDVCLRFFPSMTYLRTHKIKHCLGTPTTPRGE